MAMRSLLPKTTLLGTHEIHARQIALQKNCFVKRTRYIAGALYYSFIFTL